MSLSRAAAGPEAGAGLVVDTYTYFFPILKNQKNILSTSMGSSTGDSHELLVNLVDLADVKK